MIAVPSVSAAPARARATLLAWALALAAGLAVIWHTPFNADLSAFLPAAPDARQRVLIEQLRGGLPARSLMLAIEGGTAMERSSTSRALGQALREGGLFEQVQNGDNAAWAELGPWVVAHRYALSPAIEPARFGAAGLREAIEDTLSLLGTPAGAALKPLLERDPTGETQAIAQDSLPSRGPRTSQGVWVSTDGQRALLTTSSKAPGADLDSQAATLAHIQQAFNRLAPPPLTLVLSGTPKFAVDSRSQIEAEVRKLSLAGTLLMGTLLLVAFGSLGAVGAAALPVVSGVVAGVVTVSLGFGSVHGITLAFGTTLIGEAVDYAIYYLVQAHGAAHRGAGWRAWLQQGWPTVRLGLLTSVCGFAALAFSGFPGLAQLGVFSIAGLVAAALTTRFVLPVLLPNGARSTGLRRHLGHWAARLLHALPRWRHLFSALGLARVGVLAWHSGPLWHAGLSSLSPLSAQALALDESLRAELSGPDSGTLVVVQGASAEATLQAAEAVAKRLDAWVAQGRLGGFESVTRLLPSLATQAWRRAALPEPAQLQSALAEATAGGPLPAARLSAFVSDVAQARSAPALTPASIRDTPLAPLVNALFTVQADGRWAALLPVRAATGKFLDGVALQGALQDLEGAQWLDVGGELGQLYRHYLAQAQTQALSGAMGVVVLMALWLRSWRRLLAVSQPLLLALLLTLAGLTLARVPLGILHLVGLLLVVAVGSNYALFFDLLRQRAEADDDTLASLLLANLTTVLSFGLIALSQIPALSAIGRVVAPGALLALLLSAAYAPRANPRSAV